MLQGSIVKIDPKLAFFDSHFWSKFCLGFVVLGLGLLVAVLSILSPVCYTKDTYTNQIDWMDASPQIQ